MTEDVTVREASPADREALVEFNQRLAEESEGRRLDPTVVSAGVGRVLERSECGTYYVAEAPGPAGPRIVGQLLVTYEFSDWRDGWFWWVQSVYVDADHRRRGVFRSLYRHVQGRARARGDVCGLRLYVERGNESARATYRALGMADCSYVLMEEDWVLGASDG